MDVSVEYIESNSAHIAKRRGNEWPRNATKIPTYPLRMEMHGNEANRNLKDAKQKLNPINILESYCVQHEQTSTADPVDNE